MNFYDYQINSGYGTRTDPITNKSDFHSGIDYALPMNTEVVSNISGTVVHADNVGKGEYGKYIMIKDKSNNVHYYAHLNSVGVNINDTVNVGDILGLSGSTGRSTGAHLHYEVRDSSTKTLNPLSFTGNNASSDLGIKSWDDFSTFDLKGKVQLIVFNIFKFIIIALLIVLFVVFVTKSLDISII